MENFSEIFQLMIQDHGRRPRNFGALEQADQSAEGVNPISGDQFTIYIKIDPSGERLSQVTFSGKGSSLATTSASVMTGVLTGLSIAEAQSHIDQTLAWIAGEDQFPETDIPEDEYAVLMEIRHFPQRQKCTSLAWQTAAAALAKFQ